MQKISITGTKGKTTVLTMVSQALKKLDYNVMHVDTTGHFVNGVQLSTLQDSKDTWGLVPSVAPGRYLWEFRSNPVLKDDENATAVLECSVGCSSPAYGLGYGAHEIGVFLNIFEDHLGSSDRLKTREDIAIAKNFVFKRLNREGFAIFNGDDPLVTSQLATIPDHLGIELIPCGLTFTAFDVKAHLESGNKVVTVNEDSQIVLRTKSGDSVLCDLRLVPWTFEGLFVPSVYNMLFIAAVVCAKTKFELSENLKPVLESLRLDQYGGRLTLLKAKNGATIIADYAHEKESLKVVGSLARRMAKNGKAIGVVRLAHDRTDQMFKETGHVIAESFDQIIVYDKIDGYLRQPKNVRSKRFPQIVGRTSQILSDAILESNQHCERIIREDEAIARAAEIAQPEDVVVVIVNDDIKQSIGFIKESFKAEFA